MLTSSDVKKYVKACGADLVGIASMDRFEGAPKQMDPRYIFPDAKAMIVIGSRIHRGSLRGIEEGTFYVPYASMGYAAINHIQQPMILWNACSMLEDEGYEAVGIPNNFPWSAIDSSGQHPEKTEMVRENFSKPVTPDRPAPDVFVHMRIAAFCAGLGEIGYSKIFLTPQYGPRQRLAAIITDAPLEPDPLYDGPQLCDRCMACARDCTGQAISRDKTVKTTIAGRELEWGEIDCEKCSRFFCGASKEYNPFMVTEEDEAGFNQPVSEAQRYKIGPTYNYGRALEGARGCIRACMMHLEEKGVLENKFKHPFQRRKPWRL
jgi:ferredoxin